MKDQALIFSKDKSKKINKVPSAANFRVNIQSTIMITAVSLKSLPLVFKCFFFSEVLILSHRRRSCVGSHAITWLHTRTRMGGMGASGLYNIPFSTQ